MVHVPYRGNHMPDLLAGQVQVVFNPIAQAFPLIREGKLRALGVTPAKRSAALPEVPAIDEIVKGAMLRLVWARRSPQDAGRLKKLGSDERRSPIPG